MTLLDGATLSCHSAERRRLYVHLARGELPVNGMPIAKRDAAFVEDEALASLAAALGAAAERLLFDLRRSRTARDDIA